MKILIENPPIYEAILEAGLRPSSITIYAYGDAIYNPSNLKLRDDVIAHESVHCGQQGDDPDYWFGHQSAVSMIRNKTKTK